MTNNNVAEIRASLLGLRLEIKMGAKKIYLEGDSLIIINAIRSNRAPNWILAKWLIPIRDIITKMEHFKATHIW